MIDSKHLHTDSEPVLIDDTPLAAHLITENFKFLGYEKQGKIFLWKFQNNNSKLEEEITLFKIHQAKSSDSAKLIENFRYLITLTKGENSTR